MALAAPALWLAHDWLLTGDAFYSAGVPGRYTDLVTGRTPVEWGAWAETVADRYLALPVQLGLAAVGLVALIRRRAWLWLGALLVVGAGVLVVLGYYAHEGVYDVLALLGPGRPGPAAVRGARRRRADRRPRCSGQCRRPPGQACPRCPRGRPPRPAQPAPRCPPPGRRRHRPRRVPQAPRRRADARRHDRAGTQGPVGCRSRGADGCGCGAAWTVGVVVAALAVVLGLGAAVAALWPVGPFDPTFESTLERGQRLSGNAATAVTALRPFAADGLAGHRLRSPAGAGRLELDRPLVEVRDLFLASLDSPVDGAVAGTSAVFHDADGDQPAERFAGLNRTTAGRLGRSSWRRW